MTTFYFIRRLLFDIITLQLDKTKDDTNEDDSTRGYTNDNMIQIHERLFLMYRILMMIVTMMMMMVGCIKNHPVSSSWQSYLTSKIVNGDTTPVISLNDLPDCHCVTGSISE